MRDKSKRNVYHAISNSEKGWKVTKEGASRPSRHSREFGNPVIARPFLDSGSPLRYGRSKIPMPLAGNDEFSYRVNKNRRHHNYRLSDNAFAKDRRTPPRVRCTNSTLLKGGRLTWDVEFSSPQVLRYFH